MVDMVVDWSNKSNDDSESVLSVVAVQYDRDIVAIWNIT